MDLGGAEVLANIFTADEWQNTPVTIQDKLRKHFDDLCNDYCKYKAAANRLPDYEEKTETLQAQIQDYEVKIDNYEQNVSELRTQLNSVSAERLQLLETVTTYESQLLQSRNEKKLLSDERDSLLKLIERHTAEMDRLQQDLRSYQNQLNTAIASKCEALARVDEVESREVSLEFKERRMEQERDMLHKQIQTLTQDLNRNITELQNLRRENTVNMMHLEANVTEKVEELKIVKSQCNQYKESIEKLTQNVQDLSNKLMTQNEENQKLLDVYKCEMEAQTKLAELYKSNFEDTDLERNELSAAITDLKRMLAEASDQYGELETKMKGLQLKYEGDIENKSKIIEDLQSELKNANDLLKEVQNESVESAISKMAPSAAIASRLIRTDMSLTELYSLYVKTSEELELQKRESACLNLQLKTILSELNENAPLLKKQEIEYEKLVETNSILTQQCNELIAKKTDLEEMLENMHIKFADMEREHKRLKQSNIDTSRQVCCLLRQIDRLQKGLPIDEQNTNDTTHDDNMITTDEVITKNLVSFNNIMELHKNNQKLLLLLRETNKKLEEAEAFKEEVLEAEYQKKLDSYARKVQIMQDTLNQQNNTVATLLSKCERYKKLYFSLQKNINTSTSQINVDETSDEEYETSDEECNGSGMEAKSENGLNSTSLPATKKLKVKLQDNGKRTRDLEHQLQDVKVQYKNLKEQYEYYTQEKKNNEKILIDQFDSMRSEVRDLTSTNCKLMASLEYTKEQLKLQQKNIATYKQQINTLEERSKNYENAIAKHEQTILYLKDETFKASRSHSAAVSEAELLRHENRMYRDTIARLQSEKESYYRDQQNQALLLNNLELIKTNLERSETEGRARLEQRLDETVRELSAQRRRFQEEEDRFRETINDLKRQTETAKQNLLGEQEETEKLTKEVKNLREELTTRTQQIDELSIKLQESLTPSKNDNPVVLANKKVREIEIKLESVRIENESLNSELVKAREHVTQYHNMCESAEKEIKRLHEIHTVYVSENETKLKNLCASELNLKSRITELESELQLVTVSEAINENQPDEVKKLQHDLKVALENLNENSRNLRSVREENTKLSESLSNVESKYANEMVMHSSDIQELALVKAEYAKIRGEIDMLITERDNAKSMLDDLKQFNENSINLLSNDKEELETRVKNLNMLNSNLHDQIEALTAKMTVITQASLNNSVGSNITGVMNDSLTMDTSNSDMTKSANDSDHCNDSRNNDQLLQIIKYLRKEKDLAIAKFDILKAENTRLQSEYTILKKRNDELQDFLKTEKANTDTSLISASKHEEILRKIEFMNSVTDSNRQLREERSKTDSRLIELTEHISKLEADLIPLRSQNKELSLKIDELTSENNSLRTEAIKWRQRANILVEKSNKNPEEVKRLQTERDNLMKMLTTEKEQNKHTLDELSAIKLEKSRLDTEHSILEKQIQQFSEERKSLQSDINNMKQTNSRLMQEIMEMKNKILQKEEITQKIVDDLKTKEQQLQESKNKEVQIRKIAKRYKDSYLELLKTSSSQTSGDSNNINHSGQDTIELSGNTNAESGINTEIEQLHSEIASLKADLNSKQEHFDRMLKEFQDGKSGENLVISEEQKQSLLNETKILISNLSEERDNLLQELKVTKTKMLQISEAHESSLNDAKNQYNDTLGRMERTLVEQHTRNKDDLIRLQRENESLMTRITQLSRQLGLQQSAKPSTSSVNISDKGNISDSSPRTANVKPMSGSTTVQQSATVTPWRANETPLASIRPISVQNTRTAAILPTSQQSTIVTGVVVAGTSSSSTSTSSSSTSSVNTSSSVTGCSNTALVPPQQQVHTTGNASLETMSSSPTSSHTDYMPSTSTSASSVAVAAIPPMGSTSAAESSQEAESIQQLQPNDLQAHISAGSGSSQMQVVALVSPRVEGSGLQTVPSINSVQLIQDPGNQQPSTSGSSGCSSHITVSGHSRHAPSSSNVTTTQAGSSGGHKRPRDLEGDSSTSTEDQDNQHLSSIHTKRMRIPLHGGETSLLTAGVTDSGIDVDQVPTSSQRDQEDDVVVVDSDDDDDGMTEAEADDGGPMDGEGDGEHEVYEDSYDQDNDMDENDCPEVNEFNMSSDAREDDNNEVDVDEGSELNHSQCTSAGLLILNELNTDAGASTSSAAASAIKTYNLEADNNQQSQTISSGSCSSPIRKQSVGSLTRQQKATLMMLQQGTQQQNEHNENTDSVIMRQRTDTMDFVSSPQDSKFTHRTDTISVNLSQKMLVDISVNVVSEQHSIPVVPGIGATKTTSNDIALIMDDMTKTQTPTEPGEVLNEQRIPLDVTENIIVENSGATQSQLQDIQESQTENEGTDGVSSEGEKPTIEGMEEEGREAEATITPTINISSKNTKSQSTGRRPGRGNYHRGSSRPTPIVWQDSPGTSRNLGQGRGNTGGDLMGNQTPRGFGNQRSQRGRRIRRCNFPNMRYA